MNIYYKLGAGISRTLAQEAAWNDRAGDTILAYIADLPEASPWTRKQCRALQTHLTNLLHERADKAVYRIVHFMGYGAYLEERGGDLSKADILEALGAQEPTPVRLLERLEELRDVVQAGSTDRDSKFVLSTIHSSKGLEYQRVILMDVADGLLPKTLPEEDAPPEEWDTYEEERRLFYVGMTRAREELDIVTFRKVGLTSAFSREIFPPKRQSVPEAPKPAPVKKTGQEQIAVQSKAYLPGVKLLHKAFGPGTLVSRNGDIAVIEFDSGESKKVALSVALRAKQLRLVP